MGERALRVLHVIAHMEKGGAERQLALLVGASRHRHVIAVLAGNERESAADIVLLPDLSFSWNIRRLRHVLKEREIDILQTWLPERLTFPATVAGRLEGVPILASERRKPRDYGRYLVRDRLYYLSWIFADVIVANYPILPKGVSLARVLGLRRKTRVIPNGIVRAGAPDRLTGVPDRLLFVGRLVEQKRVALVVKALPLLAKTCGIAGLDIVGEGPERGPLEALVRAEGLSDLVTFHGARFDWPSRFDPSASFLVLPSASEGMSNTLFEAIDHGFLPVATDSAELRAMLGPFPEFPGLFRLGDAEDLARAVAELRALPVDALQARIDGLRAALDHYGVAEMAEAYDALYEELARRKD